ncbi:MAG: phosphotransferase [Clostridia bacterium]|nr:phosphotransferase [Clostridia bacterium]
MSELLRQALSCYGLEGAESVFLQHNENLTYRVAEEYLLRIHSPAPGIYAPCTIANRQAELAFLAHLCHQGMNVQQPQSTPSGDLLALLPDGTAATLLRWLPGQVLPGKEYTAELCFHAGEMTARLHQAARGFTHPGLRAYDEADARAKADLLTAMVQRHHLGDEHAGILRAACEAVAQSFTTSEDAPIAIHDDLSPSNILQTEHGLVPIDFSLCGIGLPMTDLGMLLAGFSSTVQRSAAVRGYQAAGGILRHREMEAGFIHGLLGAFVFHADTWPKEPWFPARLLRWESEMLLPFAQGKPIFDEAMNFLYLPTA